MLSYLLSQKHYLVYCRYVVAVVVVAVVVGIAQIDVISDVVDHHIELIPELVALLHYRWQQLDRPVQLMEYHRRYLKEVDLWPSYSALGDKPLMISYHLTLPYFHHRCHRKCLFLRLKSGCYSR